MAPSGLSHQYVLVSAPLQAWVVFEKAEEAQKAMEAMQGFPFFDKPIVSAGGRSCCAAACRCRPMRAAVLLL